VAFPLRICSTLPTFHHLSRRRCLNGSKNRRKPWLKTRPRMRPIKGVHKGDLRLSGDLTLTGQVRGIVRALNRGKRTEAAAPQRATGYRIIG
jgi:hypothetical protein